MEASAHARARRGGPSPHRDAGRLINRWVANTIVDWPSSHCFGCRKPIVVGQKWLELVRDDNRARFHLRLRAGVASRAGSRRPSVTVGSSTKVILKGPPFAPPQAKALIDKLLARGCLCGQPGEARLVKRPVGGGGIQIVLQCLTCGSGIGTAQAHGPLTPIF
jgi:hypothetical protein